MKVRLTQGPERRYGKALFELARDAKQLDALWQEVQTLEAALDNDEAQTFFASPVVTESQKWGALEATLKKMKAGKLLTNFVNLVAHKDRADLLLGMLFYFKQYEAEHRGLVNVDVITAHKLTAGQKKTIESFVKSKRKDAKEVSLEETVDPAIIGGFKVRIGADEFDASVKGRLNRLAGALK